MQDNKPIYRIQVLEWAKKDFMLNKYPTGLCKSIADALEYFNLCERNSLLIHKIPFFFPLFNFQNAKKLNNADGDEYGYWWKTLGKESRIKFIEWLIEQYKDDKEDLNEFEDKILAVRQVEIINNPPKIFVENTQVNP